MKIKSFYFLILYALSLCSILPLGGYLSSIVFVLVAILLWKLDKINSNNLIPPVFFIIVAYFLGYPIVILMPFLFPHLWSAVPAFAIDNAILWALRGFCSFSVGYILFGRLIKNGRLRILQKKKPHGNRFDYTSYLLKSIGWIAILSWLLMILLFGISLVFIQGNTLSVGTASSTVQQILTLMSSLRYPYFFGYLLCLISRRSDKHLTKLFIILLLISIFEIITIGAKKAIIRVIVTALLPLSFCSIKLNLKQIAVWFLALLLIYGSFSVITEYRAIMHNNYSNGIDVFNFSVQMESFEAALTASLPFSKSVSIRQTTVGKDQIFSRFASGIFSFANMIYFTKGQPPYENAWKSFLIPLYSIVPRALIPSKPIFLNSGSNARRFYGWTYGGISVTLLGSLYFAWGYMGIILGMAFLGGLFSYIVNQIRDMGLNASHWLILFVVLLLPMMDIGVTFQAVTINVMRVILLLFLFQMAYPLFLSFRHKKRKIPIRYLYHEKEI